MIRWIAIVIVGAYLKLFYRHKVFGEEHLKKGGGILAANHCSFLDPPILGVSCPQKVHFLARESLFHFRPFGWLIKQLNTHPVARGKENVSTIKRTCELIEGGAKVAIFPEGHRSESGEIGEGKAGVALLVLRTNCLVYPIYIHGTYEIWNSHQKFPRLKGRTACVFGSPLDFSQLLERDKKEVQKIITSTLMSAIVGLKQWYLEGAKGSPP